MPYMVIMLPKARGQLARFPDDWQEALLDRIEGLSLEPRPSEAHGVSDTTDIYRLPVHVKGGVIEVLYRVYDTREVVLYRVHDTLALVRIRRLTYRIL